MPASALLFWNNSHKISHLFILRHNRPKPTQFQPMLASYSVCSPVAPIARACVSCVTGLGIKLKITLVTV